LESQEKEETEVVETPEIDEETPWFLSSVDSQFRVTLDKNIRTLYNFGHKDLLWVKVRKAKP